MADAQVTTSTIDGNTVLEVIPNDSRSIRLNTNNTYVDRDIVINIEGNSNSSHNFFTITDSTSDLTVSTTSTLAKNMSNPTCPPYNPDKSFVNYTIIKTGVEWVEGAVYCFILPENFDKKSTATKANGRVRIGTGSSVPYYPIMKDETNAINMHTEYNPHRDKFFVFKKTTMTPNGGLYLMPDFGGSTLPDSDSALPDGGTAGQVLTKTDDGYAWTTVNSEDTKVTQTATTIDTPKPALIANSSSTTTDTTFFSTDVTINPGTGALNAVQFELPQQTIVCSETSTGGWVWHQ